MKRLLRAFLPIYFLMFPVFCWAEGGSPTLWERCAFANKPGCTLVNIEGYNGGITTTAEPVWPESAAYTVLSTNMSSPYCASSDNTNDKAAGTGALTISVSGVTKLYAPFTETITMNGQTSVALANTTALFINSMTVLTSGSTGANTGTIRCGTGTNTTGVPAVTHAHMPIGYGRTETAAYAVPSGYSLLCKNWTLQSYAVTAANTVDFVLDQYIDPVNSVAKLLKRKELGYLNQAGSSSFVVPDLIKIPQKTIAIVQALSAASTGPVSVSANCLLIENAWSASAQELF